MKSSNPAVPDGVSSEPLQMYVIQRDDFDSQTAPRNEDDLYLTSSPHFLRAKPQVVMNQYQEVLTAAVQQPHPVFFKYIDSQGNLKLMMGQVDDSNEHSARHQRTLTNLLRRLNLNVTKKYSDSFSNGATVYSVYIKDQLSPEQIDDIIPYCSIGFTIPDTPLMEDFLAGTFSGRELIFLHSACRFAYYFQHESNENLDSLSNALKDNAEQMRALNSLAGVGLGHEFHNLNSLYTTVQNNVDVAKALFIEFARTFNGDMDGYEYPDMKQMVAEVRSPVDRGILETFMRFIDSITTTNLWKADSMSAIAWRLDPQKFLHQHPIPEVPFCVYMMLSYDFTGFHVRFRDISRGGVRMIQSTPETYDTNRRTQFQETFNLAYTQKLKNKDIPESGSKGTILMKPGRGAMSDRAMMQYVDALMDITLKEDDDSIKDRYGAKEIIFLGPDEGTAGYMDGAALYSRERGNAFWRSFTTGKSTTMGGVPHDTYGMTTRSVRAYVTGLMRELDLDEPQCTKLMTGGPDGDLGSNEILMSKEKIVGIVDGSGVLCDPEGIDRPALEALAHKRCTVDKFDGQLSSKGFLVQIGDENITLPDGTHVRSGIDFRNGFHLWEGVTADFFVPCGGRPGSINTDNVHQMFDANGAPRYPYIVEGANLFVTAGARDVLQDRGVLLFKDASTNKGGVTSSSLEVLAGLAMNEQEFKSMMCVQDGVIPEFYQQYVKDVIKVIENNADMEFKAVYGMMKEGKRSTRATDELSEAMNGLNDVIGASDLWDNETVRRKVLEEAIPASLQANVEGGLDTILTRVPENYLRAIFSMSVGSRFIYEKGADSSPYAFYDFMKEY